MCSNMWARPVAPIGSCTEPASTKVKKEKTGASGRSQIISVRPLGSFLTVMRFSKEATSWAAAMAASRKRIAVSLRARCFMGPPVWTDIQRYVLDGHAGQKFESTWGRGGLSNGHRSLAGRRWVRPDRRKVAILCQHGEALEGEDMHGVISARLRALSARSLRTSRLSALWWGQRKSL